MPLPERDFDPTEAAITWRVLTDLGHTVTFSTPTGRPGAADDMMLTGRGLDPWGFLPVVSRFTLMGRALRANSRARAAYRQMLADAHYGSPIRWSELVAPDYDALVLTGGHRARGMREYLESEVLQRLVVQFFALERPVGAICHGVLLAARSIDPTNGHSVLHGRRTTALTWSLERRAWRLSRFTRFWDPNYYRTYLESPGEPAGHRGVQQEVTRFLKRPQDFQDVPKDIANARRKRDGRHRDSPDDPRPAFVVRDGSYVSARWPGDAHTFARQLAAAIAESAHSSS
jgi:putative intracellular protease/amidase